MVGGDSYPKWQYWIRRHQYFTGTSLFQRRWFMVYTDEAYVYRYQWRTNSFVVSINPIVD